MKDIARIREDLIEGDIHIDDLNITYRDFLLDRADFYLNKSVLTNEEYDELENLIYLFMDFYTYDENGGNIISDHEYDILMNRYIDNGGSLIFRADLLKNQTQWKFVKHESPGIVGTIKKVYDEAGLYGWFKPLISGFSGDVPRDFRIAPKFDGISSAVKMTRSDKDGSVYIEKAVTRNDGIQGQDITEVVDNSKTASGLLTIYGDRLHKGESLWIKTEIVCRSEDFNKLNEEREANGDLVYANRRSATAGIVNTPRNLQYAKFLTVIPLAVHYLSNDEIEYNPMDSITVKCLKLYDLMDAIEKMLGFIRDSSYPIRTDGVVIFPLGEDIEPNYADIMDQAIAWKVNTQEAYTEIDYGYVSVGRLGYAIPMVHVIPVEVNETTVTDVSLGSFDKFASMDLHEHEQIIVYSAGDVIPQIKLPKHRKFKAGDKILNILKRCPYCNQKLERNKSVYRCANPYCPRVRVGKIANFIIKMNAENISDKTIEDLFGAGLISDFTDIFNITEHDIEKMNGYGPDKAKMIVGEFQKIKNQETPISTLLGSLGIEGIAEKKCKMIMKILPYEKIIDMKPNKLVFELRGEDGVGHKTASIFADFIDENRDLIKKLVNVMNIVSDPTWKGNVVFTGFRDANLEKRFNDIGYEVSSNVNNNTKVVINASYSYDSTKCNAALKKGISIVHVSGVDRIIDILAGRRKE